MITLEPILLLFGLTFLIFGYMLHYYLDEHYGILLCVIGVILSFAGTYGILTELTESQLQMPPCQEFNGTCEYYNCESNNRNHGASGCLLFAQKYQNCLIKEALDKGVPVTIVGGD